MPQRDSIHNRVKQVIVKDGWKITHDPYVISYGERFLFIDLAATISSTLNQAQGSFIGATKENQRIAIEIKDFRGQSVIADLEQALVQYTLYQLLLSRMEPERELYLAITDTIYSNLFNEPIGELVITEMLLKLIIINLQTLEVRRWIPARPIEK
ncbi:MULTISPECIES: element excision factor XisH family protein [unclassified Nostoc]|uniref:element excision factor XisH family protein n=1 Tax=unclassified Nostoc TaxID=2593658 RepID=UPI00260A96A6|nr:element excision factor XisH family protein [Nostoc sp. S13]MDF5738613.1 element excision factor XisH family protein [Nostoc sp. S13]